MSPEKQRIAIAEACGLIRRKGTLVTLTPLPDIIEDGWEYPDGEWYLEPPDYLNDLNAMHEAEKTVGSWFDYDRMLC